MGLYTRETMSRNMSRTMKSTPPEARSIAPAQAVSPTPERRMALAKGDGDVDGELDPHRHPLELEHRLLHGGGVLAHRPAGPYVLDALEVVLHARQRIQADAVLPFEKARLMASAQGDDPPPKAEA